MARSHRETTKGRNASSSSLSVSRVGRQRDGNETNNEVVHDGSGLTLVVPAEDFHGPLPPGQRRRTDGFCAILLVLAWSVMTWIGEEALRRGDYRRILYPMDYDGNICGTSIHVQTKEATQTTGRTTHVNVTDYPYFYPVNFYGGGVCVKECPRLTSPSPPVDVTTLITYTGLYKLPLFNSSFVALDDHAIQSNMSHFDLSFSMNDPTMETIEIANYLLTGSDDDNDNNNNQTDNNNDEEEENKRNRPTCTLDRCFPNWNPLQSWNSEGVNGGAGYAFYVVDTRPIMNRCVASGNALAYLERFYHSIDNDNDNDNDNDDNDNDNEVSKGLQQPERGWVATACSNLYTARYHVFGFGLAMAIMVGFAYSTILRIPGVLVLLVWGSIAVALAAIAGIGVYAHYEAEGRSLPASLATFSIHSPEEDYDSTYHPNDDTDDQAPPLDPRTLKALRLLSYVSWTATGLLLMVTCALRKRIFLAIGIVKESARCIATMPCLVLFPVLQSLGLLAFALPWFLYAVHLASVGSLYTTTIDIYDNRHDNRHDNPYPSVLVRSFEYQDRTRYEGVFMLLVAFWTAHFVVAMGEIVVAMAASRWFFTRDKQRQIGNRTALTSAGTAVLYHAGTAAFGSLLLALLGTLRTLMAYLQKQVHRTTKASKANATTVTVVFTCLRCGLRCVETCLQFLNKNAYIQTAIFGTGFCVSARQSFHLIVRNAARVGTLGAIGEVVVFVGVLTVASVTSAVAYVVVDRTLVADGHISSPVAPVLAVFLLAKFTGSMFMSVFSMVTVTLLHCFIADEEMLGASNHPEHCYSSHALRTWIDTTATTTTTSSSSLTKKSKVTSS